MADSKISARSAQTTIAEDDMLLVANAASTTKKITGASLKKQMADRQGILDAGMGLKGSCFPLSPLVDWRTQLTIASQVIYGTLCPFVAGDVVSNVVSYVTTPGSGTPPTGIYVAIYSTAGVQQAVSANLASSAIWTNSTAGVNSPFEPAPISWTCPTTGVYYLCFLQNGTWGTTAMRFDAGNQGGWVRYNNLSGGNAISVTQSSQATFPTPATFSGNPNTVWFGWN